MNRTDFDPGPGWEVVPLAKLSTDYSGCNVLKMYKDGAPMGAWREKPAVRLPTQALTMIRVHWKPESGTRPAWGSEFVLQPNGSWLRISNGASWPVATLLDQITDFDPLHVEVT